MHRNGLVIDVFSYPAHTGGGRGSEFLANVVGWWKITVGQVLIVSFNDCVLVKSGQIVNPIISMDNLIQNQYSKQEQYDTIWTGWNETSGSTGFALVNTDHDWTLLAIIMLYWCCL